MGSVEPTARPATPEELTAAAVASFEACDNGRLRTVMQAFVRHLHAFASEVGLTQDEWLKAIGVLTATGHITDERRQEFILWSDTLGLSMLVDALAHQAPAGATESTVLGPFYVPGSHLRSYGENIAGEPAGQATWVHGRVLDLAGRSIPEAELDVWQNGDDQLYAVQRPEAPEDHLRGRFRVRPDGSFGFVAVRPTPYTIPDDGPVGNMLAASGRHPWRPAHIHVIVRAPGYRTVATHIFDGSSPYLDSDAVFAVKPSLLREFVLLAPGDPARPAGVEGDCYAVESDFVLAADDQPGEPVDPGRTA